MCGTRYCGLVTPLFPAAQAAHADAQLLILLAAVEQSRALSLREWAEADPEVAPALAEPLARSAKADGAVMNRLAALGVEIADVAPVSSELLAEFRQRLASQTWWEHALVQVIGYQYLADFVSLLARGAKRRVQSVVTEVVLPDAGLATLSERVTASPDGGPEGENLDKLRSLMALWGRRVAGEAIITVQRWLGEFEPLRERVLEVAAAESGVDGAPSSPEKWVLAQLTSLHLRRMGTLELAG